MVFDGREMALYGAYLSAVAFASAGSGLHHKICHVLGGTWNMPHAETRATVLPYVLAFNAPEAPEAAARIAGAFGADDASEGLRRLRETLEAPRAAGLRVQGRIHSGSRANHPADHPGVESPKAHAGKPHRLARAPLRG